MKAGTLLDAAVRRRSMLGAGSRAVRRARAPCSCRVPCGRSSCSPTSIPIRESRSGRRFRAPSVADVILIVEDDRVVAETLTQYLEQAGYFVDAVPDGVTGLARARTRASGW
jgi:hypothetical protein